MVYDHSPVQFRYPTPEAPTSTLPNGQQAAVNMSTTAVIPSPPGDHKPIHKAPCAPQLQPVQPIQPVHPPQPVQKPSQLSIPSTQAAPPVHPIQPVQPAQMKQPPPATVNRQAHEVNGKMEFQIILPTKSQLETATGTIKKEESPASFIVTGPQAPTLIQTALAAPGAVHPVYSSRETPDPKVSSSPSVPQKAAIAIELPSVPTFNENSYVVAPVEPDEPANLSLKKQKREDLDGDDLYGESLDLRQRANVALHELKAYLQAAFQAVDRAIAQKSSNEMAIFLSETEATLAAPTQTKLQSALKKTIELNCFMTVPLDDLIYLLRLCDSALRQTESLDFSVQTSWGAQDVEQWLELLPNLEAAIRAARTSMRIMCGGREEKQLYPENAIEQALSLCKRLIDGIIMPLAELRNTSDTEELFKALSSCKRRILPLMTDAQKLLSMMSELIAKVDTSETVTNALEFAASQLLFIETANAERDSVIETQKFDGFRLVAMDMICQIFLLNPSQRQGIIDEILTSLEKLPLGKRARTFKLADGSSIQPVSALIMRLVQTSAGKDEGRGSSGRLDMTEGVQKVTGAKAFIIQSEAQGASQHSTAIRDLDTISTPLLETARNNASYVIKFIVNRALNSTKSGDTPYRNLLDLFVEDFITCLDNPDWPAAELLLRLLMLMMVGLVENDKSSIMAKNMALELLGTMCAAISKLRGHVRKMASALEADELSLFLSDLAASALELKSRPEHMVAWTGPYRATLEYLQSRSRFNEDAQLSSAMTFIISEWGSKICTCYDGYQDDVLERDQELGRLAYRLREMILDRKWLSNEYTYKDVSPLQAKLSYSIILLRSQFCEAFGAILNILLNSMASDQPTVRSKSLKSINQVMEADPTILDGDSVVVQLILRSSSDSSTQVRDSALGLISKCISLRPALEEKMTETVVNRFSDAGPGVRKRAMKLAKDIYLRNSNRVLRSAIANGLLHRVQDPEESVRDLARQVIEEIWFAPFHSGETSAASQISLSEHVILMVQTVKRGNVANVLDKVLQALLSPSSKTSQASMEVCRKLVGSMFDLIDNIDSNDASAPSGRDVLQVLMIFAKAEASLFTFEQLRLLRPYIASIGTSEDLTVSRAVVVIYRRVLPQLSSAHAQFLTDVRKELLPVVAKVPRALLDDVMACLWIISTLLGTYEPLARLVISSLKGIQKTRASAQVQPLDQLKIRQFDRYSLIVGMAGKHCNLDSHHEMFKEHFPKFSGASVSKLMVDIVVPFAAPSWPLDVRKPALDCVGLVCQSSPRNYVAANVYTAFQQVFDDQIPILETMVLRSLKEFLFSEEKRSEQEPEGPAGKDGESKKKRELTVIGGTNYDDVASATTHRFLKDITRIATSTQDDHAFLAVEVLASINRQGLVHPKETGVTFITLATSTHPRISELAFLEHKALHTKHETVIEREYAKAIQSIFAYQRDIVKDPRGATTNPFTPKLHLFMEVLKISKAKNRVKFLEKLVSQIDFDIAKLDMSEELPPHVQYSRFIIENLAFFEYVTVGEIHSLVAAMERLVASTGASVAQVIESEVFHLRIDVLDAPSSQSPNPDGQLRAEAQTQGQVNPLLPDIEYSRLRQLTAASMILLAIWEVRTYLRRLYSLGTNRRENSAKPAKPQVKDLARPPVKVQGVTGDKVWEEVNNIMGALSGGRERMVRACKDLVELMSIDKEFLVPSEEDEMDLDAAGEENEFGDESDWEEGDDDMASSAGTPSGTGRGRKRKSQAGGAAGQKKKRSRSSSQQPPRKRGRPRKNPLPEAASASTQPVWLQHDEEWF